MSAEKEKWFFLRGLVREGGHWAGFLERFEKAFPDREAIPLDVPGNGSRFREKSPLSVQEMVEAVRAEFLPRKGERNHLFALSLGGMIALEWLRSHPQDFLSAVLVNTSVRGLSPLHHRLRPANYARILGMMLSGDARRIENGILAMTTTRGERRAELAHEWVRIREKHPVRVGNAVRQLLAASRFHPPKEKPPIPVLVLNGGGDRLVNPECSKALADRWRLPLRVHPTAGHDLTLDEPEWVIEQLNDWNH